MKASATQGVQSFKSRIYALLKRSYTNIKIQLRSSIFVHRTFFVHSILFFEHYTSIFVHRTRFTHKLAHKLKNPRLLTAEGSTMFITCLSYKTRSYQHTGRYIEVHLQCEEVGCTSLHGPYVMEHPS